MHKPFIMNYLHGTLEASISQWNLDGLPACPVGIELLLGYHQHAG
jgi:hypothetical protein